MFLQWFLLWLFLLIQVGCESSPRRVTMFAGSSARVAGGRAVISFLKIDEVWREDLQTFISGALVTVRCGGEDHERILFPADVAEPICGIHLRLHEVVDSSPPTVKLEVQWE